MHNIYLAKVPKTPSFNPLLLARPFLCKAAPNPFNFFTLCPSLTRRCAFAVRFCFFYLSYGLAHLHTELVQDYGVHISHFNPL